MTKLIFEKSFKMIPVFYLIFSILLLPLLSHGNYTFYEVTAYNAHERAFLYYLHIIKPTITFMNGVSNEAALPMDVIVKKDTTEIFEEQLHSFNIQYINVSEISIEPMFSEKSLSSNNISDAFYDWEDILRWLNTFAKKTNMFKKTVIAKTFERRDIFILNLSKGKKKPIVFIVGGEDGMDWMSSALMLNLFIQLIDSTSDLNILSTKFDFYLLPILNPDGFVFSKKQDRLWSKNRRVIYPQKTCKDGKLAIGVNIARNWFFQKYSKMVDEECNSINIGHKALSEEESQALSYILNSLALEMIAFINIRGFGQYITTPYGYTTEQTNNHDITMEILRSTCSKIFEKHKITYYFGTTANYFCNMADWVKIKLNTPIVYTVHLEDENSIFPLPTQIPTLQNQLFTILNESLLLAHDIYGPLFNSQENIFPIYYLNEIYIISVYLFM